MKRSQATKTDTWADNAYLEDGCVAPPIDLHAIARRQGIARIKLRLMVQEGALVPVSNGFEVYIQSLKRRDLSIDAPEPRDVLSLRQRFTLAHEIIHTRFYDTRGEIPVRTKEGKGKFIRQEYVGLEKICDNAAARLLVPTQLLKNEIRTILNGDCERIDIPFVRTMVTKFRASHEVVIKRLSIVGSGNVFARCILLVRTVNGEAQIHACYMGVTLLSSIRAPNPYEPVANWIREIPLAVTESEGGGKWEMTRGRRKLEMEKIPLGRSGDFLLQIDDPAHRAPSSK